MEFFEALKKDIQSRFEDRKNECVNLESWEQVRLSQGAARELRVLLDMVELMENPPSKDGENDSGA
ncbi:MAG: hypothetical protein WC713_04155 [Candidatus Methylomirabilota bacterium]|jgi:hypothetical protein